MDSSPAGSSSSKKRRGIRRPWALAGANGITAQDRIDTAPSGTQTPSLPPPAVAFVPPGTGNKVRLQWEKLKRRVGNGSAPSDSLGDPTATTESDNGSTWRGAVRHGSVVDEHGDKKEEIVDEVVVDQSEDFECWRRTTIPSATASHAGPATGTSPGTGQIGTMQSDGSSLRHTAYEANGPIAATVGFVRYRIWPVVTRFMAPSYHDPSVEDSYQKEFWYNQKSSHIFGAIYLSIVWALVLGLLPRPLSTWNKVQLYGLQPALTVPMIPMAAFDVPRRWGLVWQLYVFACVWIFAAANPIDMHTCGFYSQTPNCGGKDFQATLFYAAAMPTVALFALGQKRIYTVVFALSWIALMGATVVDDRPRYVRNLIIVIIFLGFIIFLHYLREMNDRRVYTMRAELKVSYRAKQRAQINERKQLDAKRRFSSYIFHEVRVPLNTALLAVQNLKGLEVFDQNSEHGVEYDALESSLQLMSQVLNDVLDFSRMERGGFSSVQRPFSLHKVMQSIAIPLRLDAAARGLTLNPSFDKRVDEVAVRAAYPDEDPTDIREGDGIVIGDEVRLRQIIGNLASNACKFTPPGGTIGLKTTLIYPIPGEDPVIGSPAPTLPTTSDFAEKSGETGILTEKGEVHASLTPNKLQEHELKNSDATKRMLVVRFEVSDTGVGIRPSDMAENRLFSPYVQTAVGREQGGKGTGLGLSLVRQIVMLMGGRLGVRSKVGEGSTLWVELAYPISTAADLPSDATGPPKRPNRVSVVSPGVASSAASDYRFVSSLRLQPSSITLDSIDDAARQRGLSVSTTPGVGSPPGSPAGPQTPSATGESSGTPSPETHRSFGLLPERPEVRSQMSSRSAPSAVTLAPDVQPVPLFSSSIPVVSPSPILKPSATSPAPPVAASSASASQVPLTTPKPQTTPASKAAAPPNKLGIDGPPLKVLVVDDDMLTRRLMSRMMLRLGCEVETAENGKIALDLILRPPPPGATNVPAVRLEVVSEEVEPAPGVPYGSYGHHDVDAAERGDGTIVKKVKKVGMDPTAGIDAFQHYDVVFLDNQMPVCSGVQVVAKLRSLGRDDLVVGVTANALQSDQEQYLESGASFILTKPVKEEDLVRHLRLADKRRVERADPTLRAQRQAKVNSSGPHFPPINSIIGPLEEDDD